MTSNEILITNIGRLCKERGMTQRQLAKKVDMMEASLSRSINGNPQLRTLDKIAKALDVSIKSLFDDPNDVEGFILLNGKYYHFNNNDELLSIQQRAKQGIKVSLG